MPGSRAPLRCFVSMLALIQAAVKALSQPWGCEKALPSTAAPKSNTLHLMFGLPTDGL
jgi:hypothetical protein